PRVVAFGETGLDYHYLPSAKVAKEKQVQVFARALQTKTEQELEAQIHDGAYKSKQASLFEQQLDLAVELGLNVVIHQRDAGADSGETLRDGAHAYRGRNDRGRAAHFVGRDWRGYNGNCGKVFSVRKMSLEGGSRSPSAMIGNKREALKFLRGEAAVFLASP